MEALRKLPKFGVKVAFIVGFSILAGSADEQPTRSPTLFSQTASAVLERDFRSPSISYLLLDSSGGVLAERWSSPAAMPPGSVVKPFLAVAYGEQHDGHFPTVLCLGTKSRCWRPSGHGSIGLEEAIAESCNAYFLELAAGLNRERGALTFTHFGLAGPPGGASDDALVGIGSEWKETPLALGRAYLALARQNGVVESRILSGMLASAAHGTAHAVDDALGDHSSFAKTGTASCTHKPRAAADGFTLVIYPAVQPRLLLLVRVHGVTGAESAKTAGAMLRSLGGGSR